jgi:hypothetical protein
MKQETMMIDPLYGPLAEVVIGVPANLEIMLRRYGRPVPPSARVRALVDSGTSMSLVDKTILAGLGLNRRSIGTQITSATGLSGRRIGLYEVRYAVMLSPSHFLLDPLVVGEMEPGQYPFEAVVGRDILQHGTFTFEGDKGFFRLEFP